MHSLFSFPKIILTSLCLLFILQVRPCVNEYFIHLDGKMEFGDSPHFIPYGRFNSNNKPYLFHKLRTADSLYKLYGQIEHYSDLGAMLIYNGEFLKAKKIFIEIENKSPGRYMTASNLGTAYELLGQNDSAYYWIDKAIKMNPGSHEGSEWIHLKLLEEKIRSKGIVKDLKPKNILGLDFGNEKIPLAPKKANLDQLRNHLYHQLNERISFVKPKESIVAQLLFDLGNLNALTVDIRNGLKTLELAKEYGYSSPVLDQRIDYFSKLQKTADKENEREKWENENPRLRIILFGLQCLTALLGFIVLVWIIVKAIKRSTKRKSEKHS
ncbi:MAG: hypothetical protein K0S32_1349 [Bacteroidetes bacterium]|nr:hypothetical protein [Bacteroidota bacterium]